MRKLILRNGPSPGDIVMLTAAVRDLKRALGAAVEVGRGCRRTARAWWLATLHAQRAGFDSPRRAR